MSWSTLLKISFFVILVVTGNLAARWLTDAITLEIRPSNEDMVHQLLMISAVAYALLIAIPFVPGIEVGLAIIALLGPPIVFLIYVSTLVGLSISYTVGRMIPLRVLINILDRWKLERASRLLETIEPMDLNDRLVLLLSKSHNRFLPFLIKHRYLALIVAINLPGNFLIGGGGGISMIAGFSRLFSPLGFLAAIAIAVAPLPLTIFLFGKAVLPN